MANFQVPKNTSIAITSSVSASNPQRFHLWRDGSYYSEYGGGAKFTIPAQSVDHEWRIIGENFGRFNSGAGYNMWRWSREQTATVGEKLIFMYDDLRNDGDFNDLIVVVRLLSQAEYLELGLAPSEK